MIDYIKIVSLFILWKLACYCLLIF